MDSKFSKELAEALIEADQTEEEEPHLVEKSYQRLCYDDPLPVGAVGCLALQKALIADEQQEPSYALSHRLVTGIQYCATRIYSKPKQQPEASFLAPTEQSDDAYAQLAWTVHAFLPLQCLSCKDLKKITVFLGSFLQEEQQIIHTQSHDDHNKINGSAAGEDEKEQKESDDSDSLQEIYAADSDGSDFEFESGFDDARELDGLNQWADIVEKAWDPLELSRPPPQPTWDMVARAVTDLLQALRHSLISSLSAAQWKKLRLAEHTTQLVLLLLNPSQTSSPLFAERPPQHWHQLGVQILHVFRDGASHGVAMEGLLRLLRILIQINASCKTTTEVSPATLAGIGSLSALCSDALADQNETLQKQLQASVLDACDDLALVLENSPPDPTLQWTFMSLFSLFSSPPSVPNSTAQLLLNSGLFRQWLLQWSQTSDENQQGSLQANLLDLCTANPALLGKYAWRFPQFAATVVVQGRRVHVLLWNLLGMHLASTNSDSSRVQWRTSPAQKQSSAAVVLTSQTCSETAWTLFGALCESTAEILRAWKTTTTNSLNSKEQCTSVSEVSILAGCLDKSPVLRQSFLQMVSSKAEASEQRLQPLQRLLSQWPTQPEKTAEKVEDQDPTNKPKHTFSERDQAMNGLRKGVKTLALLLETCGGQEGNANQQSFSSKVD